LATIPLLRICQITRQLLYSIAVPVCPDQYSKPHRPAARRITGLYVRRLEPLRVIGQVAGQEARCGCITMSMQSH
jgi:hypothetical protein